jgi:homogentisate 1,2-dioxygenase
LQNAFEQKAPGTNEVAVMIDTRDALTVTEAAETVEWSGYVDSWQSGE